MYCLSNLLPKSGRFYQYLATFSGVFSVISSGINLGWTSPYLPKLESSNSSIPTTSDEGSWCAVMPLLGAPPGAILAAFLVDRIGRKNTTLLLTPFVVFPLIGVAFAKSIWVISAARFIIGASEGGLYTALPIYVAEIAEPEIRGFLTSTLTLAAILGTLFINMIGPVTSIFVSSLICVGVPIIHFAMFFWMPESPYFYIKKHKFAEAKNSLRKLRSDGDISEEMDSLCKAVARQEQCPNAKLTDLITVPSNRKACFIYIILCLTNKFSGKNPCMFYTATIFREAGSSISHTLSVILYCSVEFVATAAAIFIVDRFGKRPLLITSSLGCAISVFFLALHFYLRTFYYDIAESMELLPVIALISYNILFSIGLAFGAVSILSELFPTNIKATALCLGDTLSVLMGTLASKFFQITKDMFGMYVPFWCFSVCSAIGMIFIIKFVPETKGKTLEEIQEYLIGDSQDSPNMKKKIPEV